VSHEYADVTMQCLIIRLRRKRGLASDQELWLAGMFAVNALKAFSTLNITLLLV
jgi:hypothetical protein